MKKVYADNGSTSFPKAPGVSDVVKNFLDCACFNINRGGYGDSYSVAMDVLDTKQLLAEMFDCSLQEVVFTPGITYSLNMLLQGLLKCKDHVIISSMEHNAIMRPLAEMSKRGVIISIIECEKDGSLMAEKIIPQLRKETKAVLMLHASNVCGTVMPIDEVSQICKKNGIRLIIDAAQTAGVLRINLNQADAIAFTGHKGLMGPHGIGGFAIKKDFAEEIKPIIFGGTGSQSDSYEQPGFLPDKFESGTLNIPGIMGLKKAIEFVSSVGMKAIYEKQMALTSVFLSKICEIKGIKIVGKKDTLNRTSVVSLDFSNKDNAAVSAKMDENFGIMTRCGLHCAPMAHKTLGTFPRGTVRFSFGYFNTLEEIDYIVLSINKLYPIL